MLLEMKDIVKVYGQVVANDHISFSLDKGEILAVVGENGAGKIYDYEGPLWNGKSHQRGDLLKWRENAFSQPS